MDTIERILIVIFIIGMTISIACLNCAYMDYSEKINNLDRRLLILETKINIYEKNLGVNK